MTETFRDPQTALDHILFWNREDVRELRRACEYLRDHGGELSHYLEGSLKQIQQLSSFQAKTITELFHGECLAVDIHGSVLASDLKDMHIYRIQFIPE